MRVRMEIVEGDREVIGVVLAGWDVLAHPVQIYEALVLGKLGLLDVRQGIVGDGHRNGRAGHVGFLIEKKGSEAVALGHGVPPYHSGNMKGGTAVIL